MDSLKRIPPNIERLRRKCPVLDCSSETQEGSINFFRFPKEKRSFGRLANLWTTFTRVKDFHPIESELMCEKHFAPECITTSKTGRVYLRKGSVPTIYDKNGTKIIVQYDANDQQYVGNDAEIMLKELNKWSTTKEEEIINERLMKIKKLKNICRFCFRNESGVKCVAMSKLGSYSIDPLDMIKILGVDTQFSEAFSELICEHCFKIILEFENYRKRCCSTQKERLIELEELDKKVEQIQRSKRYNQPYQSDGDWFKIEIDPDEFMNDDDDDCSSSDTDVSNDYHEDDICGITIKNEPNIECDLLIDENNREKNLNDGQKINNNVNEVYDENSSLNDVDGKKAKMLRKFPQPKKGVSKKLFECFFCRIKFRGLKVFKIHKCHIKRVKCEVDGCNQLFMNQGGYNVHLQRKHGLPKTSRRYCPVCMTSYQMNAIKFDDHCKICLQKNEYKEQPIECDVCKKIFNTLQSFTAHKMFHDTEKLPASALNENGVPISVKRPRYYKEQVCDLCGKIFTNNGGLSRHKKQVHLVEFTGEMYHCDLCPVAKPTKRLLYNHMKSSHIIRLHTCELCGKVFRNRELWRKHQLVHTDYKKSNLCDFCPHRPGFVTKTALQKHMQYHHGGAMPVRNYMCDVPHCRAAYSRDDQLARHRAKVHHIYTNNYPTPALK